MGRKTSIPSTQTAFWPIGTFWSAYSGNRDQAVERGIEADPVACVLMVARTKWTGTATQLLSLLEESVGERVAKSKTWPDGPRALSGQLRRAATDLRTVGVDIGFGKEGRKRTRMIHITNTRAAEAERSRPSEPSAAAALPSFVHDDTDNIVPTAANDAGDMGARAMDRRSALIH
jgi:hypothetical protein